MNVLVGMLLAVLIGVFGTVTGLDRDRAFYPVVTIVIAALYSLFAVMGQSNQALGREVLAGAGFVVLATAGFRRSLWLVVAALALHGIFDFVHGRIIDNPGVPTFWPSFCLAYDVVAAGYLAGLLMSGRVRALA